MVGFIFPIHGMTVPIPVKKFIKKFNVNFAKFKYGEA